MNYVFFNTVPGMLIVVLVSIGLLVLVTFINTRRAKEQLDIVDYTFITLYGTSVIVIINAIHLVIMSNFRPITEMMENQVSSGTMYLIIAGIYVVSFAAYYGLFRLIYKGFISFGSTQSKFALGAAIVLSPWLYFVLEIIHQYS